MVKRQIIKIDKSLCNSCGLCIDACTEGALEMVNGFATLSDESFCDGYGACTSECSPGALRVEEREAPEFDEEAARLNRENKARSKAKPQKKVNWPIKLNQVSPKAPFFKDSNIYIVSDCVPFVMQDFHTTLSKEDSSLIVSCPKFDNIETYRDKLAEIINRSNPRSITVVHMEIPCCNDIFNFIENITKESGKEIPLKRLIIAEDGSIKLIY